MNNVARAGGWMRATGRSSGLRIALAVLLGSSVLSAQSPPERERLVTADALRSMVARPIDGRAVRDVWRGENYLVLTSTRLVPGVVEVHAAMADLFVVQDGSADIRVGGTMAGGTVTRPREFRGGSITGGTVRTLGPGDILWIPAGAPHQVVRATRFRYLVVKIATRTTPR